jgi:beta-galactosidase
MQFAIGDTDFLLDGAPFRILSGALHYFRVHPAQWADRIRKARQMGLNTIETYVAWNAHAPTPAEFRLDGGLNLGRFLDMVAAEGMHAIVRPGPYICAEWTNGGLPTWLTSACPDGIRRNDPDYVEAVAGYLAALAPVLVPRQVTSGGPVILVQVENEYGAYGADKDYLRTLVKLLRGAGITVPLTTVDQPMGSMLADGSLPELHATASFGSHATQRLATLREHQRTGPLMCSEFWDGWFDSWGGHHHMTSAAEAAASLEEVLHAGASVNIYMFHGGTNFGLTNGANDKGTYAPITTSYDYDAPLDEAGNPTAKYWAFREVLARYGTVSPNSVSQNSPGREDGPVPSPPAPAFSVRAAQVVPLWNVLERLGAWQPATVLPNTGPPTADALGQVQGFTLYQAAVDVTGPAVLAVGEVRDRAQVFLDRVSVGVLARDHHDRALALPSGAHGVLELLVEDQGRVDYGPRIGEPKGLIGPVALNGVPVRDWRVMALPLTDIAPVAEELRALPPAFPSAITVPAIAGPAITVPAIAGPAFARFTFDLTAPADLFLAVAGLGKGVAWLNGFCLGRYWSRGPQRTLYVPAPATRKDENELIVLELGAADATAEFVAGPDLGHTEA